VTQPINERKRSVVQFSIHLVITKTNDIHHIRRTSLSICQIIQSLPNTAAI